MLYTFVKFLCPLACGLILSTTVLASSAADLNMHNSQSTLPALITEKFTPWENIGSSRFYSSRESASFSLDKPRSLTEIKFTMDKAIQVETARIYTKSGEVYTVPFQQPRPAVETIIRPLPKSTGLIQKVTVYYKDRGKYQGTITLLGRKRIKQGAKNSSQ